MLNFASHCFASNVNLPFIVNDCHRWLPQFKLNLFLCLAYSIVNYAYFPQNYVFALLKDMSSKQKYEQK